MFYVANARMYSVNPAAKAAWADFFGWLTRESGVDLTIVDHAFPLPLSELWSRRDLACAFMCGLPFVRADHPPVPVAAPVPRAALKPGQAVYATRLVVKADSAFTKLEDTFGSRLGYTVDDSHSGYNALRHHLLPYRLARGGSLYRESVGPLFTPRRVVEAVLTGRIDVGPLDSYAFDLMRRHESDLDRQVRVIATTDAAPIPFLVASPQCPEDVIAALKAAFAVFGDAPACAELRDRLCLERFVPVAVSDYDVIRHWDAEAVAAGYAHPA